MTHEFMLDNQQIYKKIFLISQLLEIHSENEFKIKSYTNAAFTIKKCGLELKNYSLAQLKEINGIGKTIAEKIFELIQTNEIQLLNELMQKTPIGVVEMLKIKGIGPKKIGVIWKDLEIETIGELQYACNENKLMLYKGFGQKTQENIQDGIILYLNSLGNFLYASIFEFAISIENKLQQNALNYTIELVGSFKRQDPIVNCLEFNTDGDFNTFKLNFNVDNYAIKSEIINQQIEYFCDHKINIIIHFIPKKEYVKECFIKNAHPIFIEKFNEHCIIQEDIQNEQDIFFQNNVHYITAPRRENVNILSLAMENALPPPIELKDIKGIIHCHSTWSDGFNTLLEMAIAAKEQGFEYLVITDHSKTAVYANGLSIERILLQHQEIEQINKKLYPFKIFKSIESDILNNGELDYPDEILQQLDLVIASIHSNLKMTEEKAMNRLITAIENPFTNILGHPTGRLLLSRNGYPINYDKIFDACAANNVAIEINANPRRLDLDWTKIDEALNKGILLSINPDAHSIKGFEDILYGVKIAQKTLLPKEKNISSFSLTEIQKYIAENKK